MLLLVHTTIGCGKQGFPSAQPYLSHTPVSYRSPIFQSTGMLIDVAGEINSIENSTRDKQVNTYGNLRKIQMFETFYLALALY
ncbi:hypothetical protein N7454_003222 [Penicillium verhagenii]|nr:hypothetical protein N7454_003222 [Penicillium verhagenii]